MLRLAIAGAAMSAIGSQSCPVVVLRDLGRGSLLVVGVRAIEGFVARPGGLVLVGPDGGGNESDRTLVRWSLAVGVAFPLVLALADDSFAVLRRMFCVCAVKLQPVVAASALTVFPETVEIMRSWISLVSQF